MNWDQIEGRWTELKGKAKASWGEMSDDELDQIAGKRDQMIGKLQTKYGISKEEAEKRADDWAHSI
ncbi:CsbD family protein [Chromohalobacter israelensis]|uniref:CsbD family protein n=1 Tax=Chromohalobacter israelensis TaxID=141390 RepID=UPI001CC5614F|nr:CsbD family protein [Chromohalobacter salexigens]MBZ5875542.1 CsbD family protein [Chromohalobacter salexigens]